MEAAEILAKEYCEEFDERRKNAMVCSYYKYGPIKENFQNMKFMSCFLNIK